MRFRLQSVISYYSEAARGSWLAVLLGVQSMDWGGGGGGGGHQIIILGRPRTPGRPQ